MEGQKLSSPLAPGIGGLRLGWPESLGWEVPEFWVSWLVWSQLRVEAL